MKVLPSLHCSFVHFYLFVYLFIFYFLFFYLLIYSLIICIQEAYLYYLQRKSSLAEGGLFEGLPADMLFKLIRSNFNREIQTVDFFRKCDPTFLSHLIVFSRPYKAHAGEMIYEMGDISDEITFIIRGRVGISVFDLNAAGGRSGEIKNRKNGLKTSLGYSSTGGYFGDLEYVKQSTRLGRYHALENCTLLAITFEKVREAIEKNPGPGKFFLEDLKRRYVNFEMISRECSSTVVPPAPPAPSRLRRSFLGRPMMPVHVDKPPHTAQPPDINPNNPPSTSISANKEKKLPRRSEIMRKSIMENIANSVLETFEHFGHTDAFKAAAAAAALPAKRKEIWVDGNREDQASRKGTATRRFSAQAILGKNDRSIRYIMITKNKQGTCVLGEHSLQSLQALYLLHPKDLRKQFWDGFMAVLIMFSVCIIPMQIAFSTFVIEESRWLFSVGLMIDGLFLCDIVLNFNTAYYSDSEDAYVAVRSRIVVTYLKSWFFTDLVSSIPFGDILLNFTSTADSNTLQLCRLLRLLRVVKMLRVVNFLKLSYRTEDMLNVSPAILGLCTTLAQVIFISHLICCMWWGLCTKMSEVAWFDDVKGMTPSIRDAQFHDQYVTSLYWTITTLSSVGYGDITPINNSERVLSIFIMVMGATVFGFVVANVGTIVGNFDQIEARAADRLTQMIEYMKEKNCPNGLIKEITGYFKKSIKHNSSFNEGEILSRLPVRLRIELSLIQNISILEKISLFKYIKNTSLKIFLLKILEPHFVDADDCILREGEESNKIIFLVYGKCCVCKILQPSPNIGFVKPQLSMLKMLSGKNFSNDRNNIRSPRPFFAQHKINDRGQGKEKEKVKVTPLVSTLKSLSVRFPLKTPWTSSTSVERNAPKIGQPSTTVRVPNNAYDDASKENGDFSLSKMLSKIGSMRNNQQSSRKINQWQTPEASKRAQANWAKAKKLIPKIAAIKRHEEERVDKHGYAYLHAHRPIDSINVMTQIRGHYERVLTDVRPLGTLQTGGFIGHTAMMQSRPYASSVVVTEPCHYFSLHKKDILDLVENQPGIALELQFALSMTISEMKKKENFDHKKSVAKWFLDDVKVRFRSKKKEMLAKGKQPLSKMLLSLALSAKAKEEEKKEEERKEKEKEEARNAVLMKGRSTRAGVRQIQAVVRRANFGGNFLSSRVAAAPSNESSLYKGENGESTPKKRKNLGIFRITSPDAGAVSAKQPSYEKFFYNIRELDPGARNIKQILADKMAKLDKLEGLFFAKMDEFGSDEEESDLWNYGTGRGQSGADASGKGESDHFNVRRNLKKSFSRKFGKLKSSGSLILSSASATSDTEKAVSRAAAIQAAFLDPDGSEPSSSNLIPRCTGSAESGLFGLGPKARKPRGSKVRPLGSAANSNSNVKTAMIGNSGDYGPLQTSNGQHNDQIEDNEVFGDPTSSRIRSMNNRNHSNSGSNSNRIRKSADCRNQYDEHGFVTPKTSNSNETNEVITYDDSMKLNNDIDFDEIYKTDESAGEDSPNTNPLHMSQQGSRKKGRSASLENSFNDRILNPSVVLKEALTNSLRKNTLISLKSKELGIRLPRIGRRKQGGGKKKVRTLKKHKSISDLLDIYGCSDYKAQAASAVAHPGLQFKPGVYVQGDSGSFFAPQSTYATMHRRKSYPSRDSELQARLISEKDII